ncbi:MAG: hypothetical protein P9M03_10180, partial [Candidatus Theseobacter exili]|nr:hypothetical protein [Candidatus Theseobacter exili]
MMDSKHFKILYFLFPAISLFLISIINFYIPSKLSIVIKPGIELSQERFKIFYDAGNGYSESDSSGYKIITSKQFTNLEFNLPARQIKKIRIDPGVKEGVYLIKRICIKSLLNEYCWSPSEIIKDFRPLHHISEFCIKNKLLYLQSIGNDPFFEYNADPEVINKVNLFPKKGVVIVLVILASFFYLIYYSVKKIYFRFLNKSSFYSAKNTKLRESFLKRFLVLSCIYIFSFGIALFTYCFIHIPFSNPWDILGPLTIAK